MAVKVLVIGLGNMAHALISRMLDQGTLNREDIYAVAHGEKSLQKIADLNIQTYSADDDMAFDVVMLGVKPQALKSIVPEHREVVSKSHLLISMLAGVECKTLQSTFDCQAVVRIMPNMPCAIGQGVVGYYMPKQSLAIQLEALFAPCGAVVAVEKEEHLHLVTALAGSGTAFYYYIIRSFVDQAVAMGLERKSATKMAAMTCQGAGAYVLQEGEAKHLSDMIASVASKGGTTQAGLDCLAENKVDERLSMVVNAVYKRSLQLSGD
ncbi:MAG: pyrroline-5-carboxylate reductase [Pseudomonadota bacterium]|nr:pyrroline-5-carboxylate reductase [Pseudomonadota bacterium]